MAKTINFEMVGKLKAIKETEKFKPYEERKSEKGWLTQSLKFNVLSGTNRHMLEIRAGHFADDSGTIFTMKNTYDEKGNRTGIEKITISFKERLTHKDLPCIAEFKKFVIDLEKPKRRKLLEKMLEDYKEGIDISDDRLKIVGLNDANEIETELINSKKLRKEFISEVDYLKEIKSIISNNNYSDKKFLIRGSLSASYSQKNQKFYTSLNPSRIYLADDETEDKSTISPTVYFKEGCLDTTVYEEKSKDYINSYVFVYDSQLKKDVPMPFEFALINTKEDKLSEKRFKHMEKIFSPNEDDGWREYVIVLDMIDGAEKKELTFDMLTEEQQEEIELGFITLEDIRREQGQTYGDNIKEYHFKKFITSGGTKETSYTDDDFVIEIDNEDEAPFDTDKDVSSIEDIFDDDEL